MLRENAALESREGNKDEGASQEKCSLKAKQNQGKRGSLNNSAARRLMETLG